MKISVVILNYRGLSDTLECINSVKNSQLETEVQIVVVDNNSRDGSQKSLKKVKGIKLIVNEENLGYSGGNNVGIKLALKDNATHVCILNNDAILEKKALSNLLNASSENTIVSPKIYFFPGYEFHKARYKKEDLGKVIWYAGGVIDWNNILGVHKGVDEVDKNRSEKKEEIDFATGACMFVPAMVFKKVGLFDEKYFLYLEDMDFSVRAKMSGVKIIYEPKAIVWHKNAASAGGSGSIIQDYYISRNRLLFAAKYAKLKTKLALLKQIILQTKVSSKRTALLDFLTMKFGKCTKYIK